MASVCWGESHRFPGTLTRAPLQLVPSDLWSGSNVLSVLKMRKLRGPTDLPGGDHSDSKWWKGNSNPGRQAGLRGVHELSHHALQSKSWVSLTHCEALPSSLTSRPCSNEWLLPLLQRAHINTNANIYINVIQSLMALLVRLFFFKKYFILGVVQMSFFMLLCVVSFFNY